MAFADVLPYFRTRMTALGYSKEHSDAFNTANIGSTVLDDSYHLEIGSFSGGAVGHGCQDVASPVILRVFRRGYRKPGTERDSALTDAQTIVEDIASHANAINGPMVHTVRFDSLELEPIDDSNDNSFIIVIGFTSLVVLSL